MGADAGSTRAAHGFRILWQSSTALDGLPKYREAIETHARNVLSPGSEIVVRGVARGVSDLHFRSIDFLNNGEVLRSVLAARSLPVDAVALGCFVDPLLDEFREVLDVPVLGMAETAMHLACMLGRRFAVLSRRNAFATKFHRELVAKYGLMTRSAGEFAFDLELEELVTALQGDPGRAISSLVAAGRVAVDAGAEVLLVGCGILNLVAVNAGLREINGARVLDTTGALLKMSETMAALAHASGSTVSRRGLYESPPAETLSHALQTYGMTPDLPVRGPPS